MLFDKDAGHRQFLEDVYENQYRIPGGEWDEKASWTDVKGDAATGRDKIELPEGWEWEDAWQSDTNRAVDEEGAAIYCLLFLLVIHLGLKK